MLSTYASAMFSLHAFCGENLALGNGIVFYHCLTNFTVCSSQLPGMEDYIPINVVEGSIATASSLFLLDIPIINDSTVEELEAFQVTLSTTEDGVILTNSTATITIADDDSKCFTS